MELLEMGGNDWEWVDIVGNGGEWMGMVRNGMEMVGMVGNGGKWWVGFLKTSPWVSLDIFLFGIFLC